MGDPLIEDGSVEVMATNISDAIMGIAVPEYVHEAAVKTEADLAELRERLDGKIYGIGAGGGFNDLISDAISNERHGPGDWQTLPASTSGMPGTVSKWLDDVQTRDGESAIAAVRMAYAD